MYQDKFFSNMSGAPRNARGRYGNTRPVKVSEVEAAQREVVETTRRLIDAGTILVGGIGGGEELVY